MTYLEPHSLVLCGVRILDSGLFTSKVCALSSLLSNPCKEMKLSGSDGWEVSVGGTRASLVKLRPQDVAPADI